MSFLTSGRAGLALAACLCWVAGAASAQRSGPNSVRTVDAETSAPVQGVQIVVDYQFSGTTDESGRVVLPALRPGEHRLRVRRIGYLPQILAIHATADSVTSEVRLQPIAVPLPSIVVKNSARWSPLNSVRADRELLAAAAGETARMLRLVKALSGSTFGEQQLIVDGLETRALSGQEQIGAIDVNPDPYSVLRGESEVDLIELSLDDAPKDLRWSVGFLPNIFRGRNPLARSASSSQEVRDAFISVPLFSRVALALSGSSAHMQERKPVASFPDSNGVFAVPVAADMRTRTISGSAFGRWSEQSHIRVSFNRSVTNGTNSQSGGVINWSSPISNEQDSRDVRLTGEVPVGRFLFKSGFAHSHRVAAFTSSDLNPGISILETSVTGDPPYPWMQTEASEWRWNSVLRSMESGLQMGWTFVRYTDSESLDPNSHGELLFGSVDEHARWVRGESDATRTIAVGRSRGSMSSTVASVFAEREWAPSVPLALRAGLRMDYTGRFWHPSPRLSLNASFGRVSLQSAVGVFRQAVSNPVIMQAQRYRPGDAARRFITPANRSQTGADSIPLYSIIDPRFEPSGAVSIRHVADFASEKFSFGMEHVWTHGFSRAGSRRLLGAQQWTDLLESRRRMDKNRIHARFGYRAAMGSLVAHYEWVFQKDNSDGPFAFAESQGDLRSEWARSTGVSPHNLSIVGMLPASAIVDGALVFTARSGAPFNIRTGIDPDGSALFNDRGGYDRNSGTGPAFRSLDAFLHKRVRIPFTGNNQRIPSLDLSLTAENLLGRNNFVSVGANRASPFFGLPLAAFPARSFSVSFRLAH